MSTPSRSKPIPLPRSARIKLDDDLPPPSTTATSNFLDQTYSVSKFSTSTPIVRKSSTVFESPMKSDVKMPLSPILKSRKPASESPLVHFNESFSSSNPCASNITPKRTLPNIHQNFSPKSQEKSMNFNILKESNQPGINEIKIDGTVSLNELIENILFPGKMNDNNNDEKENV
uniref:Uncharacterized protein n=1 Tax=Panagrolaimus davidi TaxID=227884 RepID=A0A914Q353_9BILA